LVRRALAGGLDSCPKALQLAIAAKAKHIGIDNSFILGSSKCRGRFSQPNGQHPNAAPPKSTQREPPLFYRAAADCDTSGAEGAKKDKMTGMEGHQRPKNWRQNIFDTLTSLSGLL
jgi:hypothetical protein